MIVAELIELLKQENQDAKVINKYTGEEPTVTTDIIYREDRRDWADYECVIG